MADLPRFQLLIHGNEGWKQVRTFRSLDEAAAWIQPQCRILPIEPPAPSRTPMLLGIFLSGVLGTCIGALGHWISK